jgi:hypothetical protein
MMWGVFKKQPVGHRAVCIERLGAHVAYTVAIRFDNKTEVRRVRKVKDIIALRATKEEAEALARSLDVAVAEYNRRAKAAIDWLREEKRRLIEGESK